MAEYQYKVISARGDIKHLEASINKLGEDGWKLIGTISDAYEPKLFFMLVATEDVSNCFDLPGLTGAVKGKK